MLDPMIAATILYTLVRSTLHIILWSWCGQLAEGVLLFIIIVTYIELNLICLGLNANTTQTRMAAHRSMIWVWITHAALGLMAICTLMHTCSLCYVMDYVAAYHMEHLLASCVDEVCGHQIPIRAMQLRTMLLETNRMTRHRSSCSVCLVVLTSSLLVLLREYAA